MSAGHPQLTNLQAVYVAISRARDRADLVTDDAGKLADQLEKADRGADFGAGRGAIPITKRRPSRSTGRAT